MQGAWQTTGVWFFGKKSQSCVRNALEHCRNGGANCLSTSTPVSCAAQHHIGDIPVVLFDDCLTLWRIFVVYNENSTRALNTTSLKCCLPSTNTIDREEKNSLMSMKVQGRHMQGLFIEIPRFLKK